MALILIAEVSILFGKENKTKLPFLYYFTNTKQRYCVQVFGNVWGIRTMDETERRFLAFTKEDNRRLQVLQNKILRLKTGLGRDTPTKELLKRSGDLSIHQLIAYHTIMMVFKTMIEIHLSEKGSGLFAMGELNTKFGN